MYHDIVLLNFEANGPEGNNINFTCIFRVSQNCLASRQLLVYHIKGKTFEGIAFDQGVRAMKPFQCRHKCQNKGFCCLKTPVQ